MDKKRSFFNLDETLRQAIEQFAALDPVTIAARAGVSYDHNQQTLTVNFLGAPHRVLHPSGEVFDPAGQQASTYIAIIILHYLVTAKGTPLTGKWIAYRHLPGGDIYNDPFQKRAVNPFLQTFGSNPEAFRNAALALGGTELQQSGISFSFTVLPRAPLCFTLWPGDDELPASATILFDETAPDYLPTEDYAHLPAIVNGAMKKKL